MKINLLRKALLACAVFVVLAFSMAPASAQAVVRVQVGTPPPPVVVERQWAAPYRGAVWIPGHHEWVRGRWVWIGGYYTYPPRRGGHWVASGYRHGYYYPGHWVY